MIYAYKTQDIVSCKTLDTWSYITPGDGAQWLSGRVLDSRLRGCRFEPHRRHCVVVLEQDIYPCLVLV